MTKPNTIRAMTGILLALVTTQVWAQDTVTLRKSERRGNKVLGTIKSASRTNLIVETGGVERDIPVNEIERIGLAGEPTGLRQGRTSIFSGQYEQALESLDSVRMPSGASDIMQQEAAFYRASAYANLALRGSGSVSDAVSLLRAFLTKQGRTSIHYYPAVELLGQLADQVGRYENAAKYYQQLAKAPWPEYKLKSYVLEGNSLRAAGKPDEAVLRFAEALKVPSKDAAALRQQTLAKIGQAACVAEGGDAETALATLDQVIAQNDATDAELFALAYLAQGAANRKAQQPLEAILSYLHIDLLYFQQQAAHAEALYYLSELWPQVNNPDRGVQARSLLKERYGSTGWAKKD